MSAVGSPAADGENAVSSEVNYKFCQECSNLLYPKETRSGADWILTYFCKACHHVQEANPSCTFRRELGANVTETAGVTTDVSNDPTLPRSQEKCPRCGESENVYFQSQQRGGDTTMKLYYVCLSCNHVFVTVPKSDS